MRLVLLAWSCKIAIMVHGGVDVVNPVSFETPLEGLRLSLPNQATGWSGDTSHSSWVFVDTLDGWKALLIEQLGPAVMILLSRVHE